MILCLTALPPLQGAEAAAVDVGPAYAEFAVTLAPNRRTEAVGPVFYHERGEDLRQWAFPPLISWTENVGVDATEVDVLYPLITYDRFGGEHRWQFLQLFSTSGGDNIQDNHRDRFTIFPFYFQQRSKDTSLNYTALLPIYGTLKNRLLRDEIFFVLFPVYSETRKRDVVTDNYLFPFFHLRTGNELSGWQFWPVVGHETKGVTIRTNNYDLVETIGGHTKFFAAWPLFFNNHLGLGTTNEVHEHALLPAYSWYRSPARDSSTYLWPFFTYIDDREKGYREWGMPWPFIDFARGPGKTTDRIWPLFSRARTESAESDFYLWPVYMTKALHAPSLERRRTRILFFLYSDLREINPVTSDYLRRRDFWPFYTHRRDLNGNRRLQVLAPLEPLIPNNKSIERNYSPLWSLWRSEQNASTGATSQSLFWNLWRRETTYTTKKCSLFFGLFQYEKTPAGSRQRWFFIPFGKPAPADDAAAPPP